MPIYCHSLLILTTILQAFQEVPIVLPVVLLDKRTVSSDKKGLIRKLCQELKKTEYQTLF